MANKKKILHLIQSLESGGCENMLLRTLPLLAEFEHHILTLKDRGGLAPRFEQSGIPVETIGMSSALSPAGLSLLKNEIQASSSDIIITYLFHADMLGRLFVRRYFHGPIIPFLRTTYNHPKYLIARILERLTKGLASHYLANSVAVKNFYIKNIGVPAEKITVIPNGIDIAAFDAIIPDQKLRESIGIAESDTVFICVANFHQNKGHRYLLEAFDGVHQTYPQTKLLLVGDGEERTRLEQQVSPYGSKNAILFFGQRTDVPQLLKLSHIFVLPTLFEGMSNALLEAMASRLSVITTDIPENRSFLENQANALLVSPKSKDALKKAMETLLDHPEKMNTYGQTAHFAIQSKFSLPKIAQLWTNFLSTNLP